MIIWAVFWVFVKRFRIFRQGKTGYTLEKIPWGYLPPWQFTLQNFSFLNFRTLYSTKAFPIHSRSIDSGILFHFIQRWVPFFQKGLPLTIMSV
jgi:hypothetical protein